MAPPDRGSYLRAVEASFTAARAQGFMLSPRDVARVDAWRRRGVPLEVVLRVIDEGVTRYRRDRSGERAPRSLGWFEARIDDAFARHLSRRQRAQATAGPRDGSTAPEAEPDAPLDALIEAIADAGRAQAAACPRDVLRRAWRRLREAAGAGAEVDVWALAQSLDDATMADLIACLEPPERAELERSADAAVARAGGPSMSDVARREHHAFAFARAVRERFAVPSLVEVLVEHAL